MQTPLRWALPGLLLLACVTTAAPKPPPAPYSENHVTTFGDVKQIQRDPAGRATALTLEDGTVVTWLTTPSPWLSDVVVPSAPLLVAGSTQWDNAGRPVVIAERIRNLRNQAMLEFREGPGVGGSEPPPGQRRERGRVEVFVYDRHGAVTELVLDTGRRVLFPSAEAWRVEALVHANQPVMVVGDPARDALGNDAIRATWLTALDSGKGLDLSR